MSDLVKLINNIRTVNELFTINDEKSSMSSLIGAKRVWRTAELELCIQIVAFWRRELVLADLNRREIRDDKDQY